MSYFENTPNINLYYKKKESISNELVIESILPIFYRRWIISSCLQFTKINVYSFQSNVRAVIQLCKMNTIGKSYAENEETPQSLKRKLHEVELAVVHDVKKHKTGKNLTALNDAIQKSDHQRLEDDTSKTSQSPKKRLELPSSSKQKQENDKKEKFIYGNYSQYYGYRNKDFHDVRLDVFAVRKELFEHKNVLDIGCNNGFITTTVSKEFNVKSIVGIDIDRALINQAIKNITKNKKKLPMENVARTENRYPYNVKFVHGNYVLKDDCLLEIERPQFDTILCLSITKWIQLNFGDAGLKQAFRRMFIQLRSGGKLILEAQPIKNYKKRKYLSEAARTNFKNMKLLPENFTDFLLSHDVGFKKMELLGVPEHCADGFKRPIQIFYKE